MINKKLGNTDLQLSSIGLGAWAIGGGNYRFGWGSQDDKESIATIRRAVELGINWIDTAPAYGEGHSEKIVNEALKGIRDKVIISTKCGLHVDETGEQFVHNLKKESIRTDVEASLKRLNTETIDLYMIHMPIPDEDIEEAWRTLEDLVKEGKIQYSGVSSFTLEQLKRIQPIHPIIFILDHYNMLARTIEDKTLDYCASNHIGVFAYCPMYRGLLTGKFTKERAENFPTDDNRKGDPHFQEPNLGANFQLLERLRPIAERNNKTLAQLTIAWVLRRPEVTSAIVGARRPSQIEETAPAGDWVLSGEDKADLDTILKDHHARLKELQAHEEDI